MPLRIPVIDYKGDTVAPPVEWHNTMLEAVYGPSISSDVVIVKLDQDQPVPPIIRYNGENFFPDCYGSGIKKHQVIYSGWNLYLASTYSTYAEDIAYASILFSNNRLPPQVMSKSTINVVQDGERFTGDTSGWMCYDDIEDLLHQDIARCKEQVRRGIPKHVPSEKCSAAQFRLVDSVRGRLAKGTIRGILYGHTGEMVLPESCFKGCSSADRLDFTHHKPFFAIREWAEPRPMSIGYQILQWMTTEAVDRDIIPSAVIDMAFTKDIEDVKEHLVSWLGMDKLDEPRMALEAILKADRYGLLNEHPVLRRRVRGLIRKWRLELGLSGGLKGTALMSIPNNTLAHGEIMTSVAGWSHRKEMVMWRYPITSHNSVRCVEHTFNFDVPYGVVEMSESTALDFQGDFDGDYFGIIPALEIPNIADVVRDQQDENVISTDGKTRLQSEFTQENVITVINRARETSSKIGSISNLITRARAWAPENVQLIRDLGYQLQAAVDGVKWNTKIDGTVISHADETLPRLDWLQWSKDKDCWNYYVEKSEAPGVIAHIWNSVQEHFVPFQEVCFPESSTYRCLVPYKVDPAFEKMVKEVMTNLYIIPITGAEDEDAIMQTCKNWIRWTGGQGAIYQGEKVDGLHPDRKGEVWEALWNMCHKPNKMPLAACFLGFTDEITTMLENLEIIHVTVMDDPETNRRIGSAITSDLRIIPVRLLRWYLSHPHHQQWAA